MTAFPNGVYSKVAVTSTSPSNSPSHAGQHNALSDEIVAIETTLGANPQGGSASVAARFTSVEAAVATNAASLVGKASTSHADTHATGGTDRITLSPSQISQSGAANGQALIWDGNTWVPTTISAPNVNPSQITQGGANVNQALIWNGTAWAPANVSVTSIAPNQITQGGATTGQALYWNGTNWTPTDFGPTTRGSVTQATKGDAVTLNAISGTITNPATGGGTFTAASRNSFVFTNSYLTQNSIFLYELLKHPSNTSSLPLGNDASWPTSANAQINGLFMSVTNNNTPNTRTIQLRNTWTSSWSDGYIINFVILNLPSI